MAARVTLPEEVTAKAMLADMRVVNFTAATRSVAEADSTLVAGSTAAADSMVDAGNECVKKDDCGWQLRAAGRFYYGSALGYSTVRPGLFGDL